MATNKLFGNSSVVYPTIHWSVILHITDRRDIKFCELDRDTYAVSCHSFGSYPTARRTFFFFTVVLLLLSHCIAIAAF